jgi:hypothetical protein
VACISAYYPAALFTSGGGVALLPLGVAELLRARRWKGAALFGGMASLLLALYFVGYATPAHHQPLSENLADPVRMVRFALAFLGSCVGSTRDYNPAAEAIGAVTLAALLFCVVRWWSERFLCLLAGFVLLTDAVTTLTRRFTGLLCTEQPAGGPGGRWSWRPSSFRHCCTV